MCIYLMSQIPAREANLDQKITFDDLRSRRYAFYRPDDMAVP